MSRFEFQRAKIMKKSCELRYVKAFANPTLAKDKSMNDAVALKGQLGKPAGGARAPLWAMTWLTIAVPDAVATPLRTVPTVPTAHTPAESDPDLALADQLAKLAEGTAAAEVPLRTVSVPAHQPLDHHHRRFHFGACAAVVMPVGNTETHQSLGGEAFVEWNAVPGWMALELSAGGMVHAEGVQLIVNVLYKKSFSINNRLSPYLGVGPLFAPTVADGESSFEYGVGGSAVAGTHIWLTSRLGLVTELKYNLLHQIRDEGTGPVHELGAAAGFVVTH